MDGEVGIIAITFFSGVLNLLLSDRFMVSESELESMELVYWNSFLLPTGFLDLRHDLSIGDVTGSSSLKLGAGVSVDRRERIGEDGIFENGLFRQCFDEDNFLMDLVMMGDGGELEALDSLISSSSVSIFCMGSPQRRGLMDNDFSWFGSASFLNP